MSLSIVILAAGKGTRLRSFQPKVLHTLAGKPLLQHTLDAVSKLAAEHIFIVHGHQGEQVQAAFAQDSKLRWVKQAECRGTGHALQQVLPLLDPHHRVLILCGDMPLIQPQTLDAFLQNTKPNQLGLLTAFVPKPQGLGRIVRDANRQVEKIIEEKDATPLEREIQEVNSGVYCVLAKHLFEWLPRLQSRNAQNEYYLTDIVAFAQAEQLEIAVTHPGMPEEIYGVNTRSELARLERVYQALQAEKLMSEGVSLADPSRIDIRGQVISAQDCFIDINVILEGQVILGERCKIGPHVCLKNVVLGPDVEIRSHCVIEGAQIEAQAVVGPFARIRPNTVLKGQAHIGNFVEIKNSVIGQASKVNHLSYIGDTQMGAQVNIGAGTITCNYDGVHKHPTTIADHVHIGADVQLIAPVHVGQGATIAAGTTVMKDVAPDCLVINPKTQASNAHWKRPQKR